MLNLFRKVPLIPVDELKAKLEKEKGDDFTLLDVREPREYEGGHLPGATHIPLSRLADRLNELDRTKPLVTYCKSGRRSGSAASILAGRGFHGVRSLDGGMDAWNGIVATGEYSRGLELLEGVRSAVDILPLALALEEGARLFYAGVGKMLQGDEAAGVFAALVKAEEEHKRKLTEACRVLIPDTRCEIPTGEEGLRGYMEGAVRIDEALDWARSRRGSRLELLDLSMQMEANSLDFYLKIAGRSEFTPVREVLDELIEDEKDHLRRLAALLEESV
jgi:rhodanese-related sulfurtransferase/rubrerythrin